MKRKSSKKAMGVGSAVQPRPANQVRLTKRITNQKRHTISYVDSAGRKYTPRQAAQMARQGRIAGVRAVGNHIQSEPGRKKLADLPFSVS